ncbi:MAG: helix-turn-helix domain-containing protein [Caulobacteraceae bacterium]
MAELTPEACRAGRALLSWGVRDLAAEAGVGVATVARYEAGAALRPETIDKLHEAFEANGVEITNGKGTGARLLRKRP